MRWDRPHKDPVDRRRWRPEERGAHSFRSGRSGTCILCGERWSRGTPIERCESPPGWAHVSCPVLEAFTTGKGICSQCLEPLDECRCTRPQKRDTR